MHSKNFFPKGTRRKNIIQFIKDAGFNPILITDRSGFIYETHTHPETTLIVCLDGSMNVRLNDEIFDFEQGDKILIPGNTTHSGVVGPHGCIYFWSEKLV